MIKIASLRSIFARTFPYLLLSGGLAVVSSCSNTKYLPQGQALYKESRVNWIGGKEERDGEIRKLESDLSSFDRQEPNKKLLGLFPFKLWFYNQLSQSDTGFVQSWVDNDRGIGFVKKPLGEVLYPDNKPRVRDWFIQNIGEPPVLYDSVLVEEAAEVMEVYLRNNGFFQTDVVPEHEIRRRKGTAVYTVTPGPRYFLRNLYQVVGDTLIARLIQQPEKNPVLQSGQPYRLDDLKAERVRIRDTLLNNGFYDFDRNLVEFEVDSLIGNRQLDIYTHILPPLEDSMHRRYRIGEVFVFPDYSPEIRAGAAAADTLVRRKIHIVYRQLQYKPSALLNPVFIKPSAWYNAADYSLTLRKYSELGAFRFVSITYRPPKADTSSGPVRTLDAFIRLQPARKQQWSAELNANTNFNSLIGSDLDFSYRNRNLFRNADLFTLNLSSGVETQVGEGETFVRNVDFTGTANLDIPKFVVPFRIRRSRTFNPVTSFAARYTFTQRIEFYTLHSTSLTLAYSWRRNPEIAHRLATVDVSLVRPTEITDPFRAILNDNLLLTQSFQQQIIPASSYSFLYNATNYRQTGNGMFFRGTLESAGNLVNGLAGLAAVNRDTVNSVFGIPLSQFVRVQTDYRYYLNTRPEQTWVFRLATGIGVPYGNSAALPFVRQFFVGGPSSVRAWRVRRLGPGSFEAPEDGGEQNVFIDQTADMLLEANVEYRFPIYKVVKGAFFVDAGNVWLLKEDVTRPGARISSDFYREIAMGTGLGLRLDFSLFIFRADFGLRVYDPAVQGKDAWLFTHPDAYLDDFSRNTEFNIAIGYPF